MFCNKKDVWHSESGDFLILSVKVEWNEGKTKLMKDKLPTWRLLVKIFYVPERSYFCCLHVLGKYSAFIRKCNNSVLNLTQHI